MNTIDLILYILAFCCFVIAIFAQPWPNSSVSNPRFSFNLIALGLAFWVLASLIASLKLVIG